MFGKNGLKSVAETIVIHSVDCHQGFMVKLDIHQIGHLPNWTFTILSICKLDISKVFQLLVILDITLVILGLNLLFEETLWICSICPIWPIFIFSVMRKIDQDHEIFPKWLAKQILISICPIWPICPKWPIWLTSYILPKIAK